MGMESYWLQSLLLWVLVKSIISVSITVLETGTIFRLIQPLIPPIPMTTSFISEV